MNTDLTIVINAINNAQAALRDAAAGISGLSAAGDQSSTAVKQSFSDMLSDVRSDALQAVAVTGGAFAGISAEIYNASGTANQLHLSFADIQNTLKDTGSKLPISQLEEFAASQSKVTNFSDQQVASSLQLIVGNKGLQGSYQEVIKTAEDMAAHMGVDLPTATAALMKVLNDPATAVTRLANSYNIDLGPALTKTITAMGKNGDVAGAQNAIMQDVEKQIGGAAAAAKAADDGLQGLSNTTQILQQKIGGALNPDLKTLYGAIGDVVTKVTDWVSAHPVLTARLIELAAALTGVITVILSAIIALTSIGIAITSIGTVITTVGPIFGVIVAAITSISAPVLLLVGLIALLAYVWIAHWGDIKVGVQVVLEWMGNFFKTTWAAINTDTNAFLEEIEKYFQSFASTVTNIWNNLWNTISGIVNSIMAAIKKVTSGVSAIAGGIGGAIGGTVNAMVKAVPFAAGGIVNSPTFAMIGEAGPEAVIPLSAFNGGSSLSSSMGGGSAGNIVINIMGGNYLDRSGADMIAQALASKINTQLKLKRVA